MKELVEIARQKERTKAESAASKTETTEKIGVSDSSVVSGGTQDTDGTIATEATEAVKTVQVTGDKDGVFRPMPNSNDT